MEKKVKVSENPKLARIIYSIVIAALCITAIIIGIVAANNRDNSNVPTNPPSSDTTDDTTPPDNSTDDENPTENPPASEPEKLTFIAPVSGKVINSHSLTVPVFSPTLEEWRVHAGIDISCDDAAAVFAAADGVVSEISTHPRFGYTVKIEHENGVTTVYSNLSSLDGITVKVGDTVKCGDKIAVVGDSSVYELAEEPHLHFEAIENGEKIDPLSILSDESKKASLGIGS